MSWIFDEIAACLKIERKRADAEVEFREHLAKQKEKLMRMHMHRPYDSETAACIGSVPPQSKPRLLLAASVWVCETEDANGFGLCPEEAYEEWKFDRDAGRIALGKGK